MVIKIFQCVDCGVAFESHLSEESAKIKGYVAKYCPICRKKSCNRISSRWRTEEIYRDSAGYIMKRLSRKRDDVAGWYTPEHRLVMEQILGRKLRKGEIVHHVDGDRANNAPSNLDLFVRNGHPNGIRASGLICPHCGMPYLIPNPSI